jgi:hypothetical protein
MRDDEIEQLHDIETIPPVYLYMCTIGDRIFYKDLDTKKTFMEEIKYKSYRQITN